MATYIKRLRVPGEFGYSLTMITEPILRSSQEFEQAAVIVGPGPNYNVGAAPVRQGDSRAPDSHIMQALRTNARSGGVGN